VSASEVADCISALKALSTDEIDKHNLSSLMNSTMLKREWGAEYISRLVDLYFELGGEDTESGKAALTLPVSSSMGTGMGRWGKGAPVDVLTDLVMKRNIEQVCSIVKGLNFGQPLLAGNEEETISNFKRESGWFEVSNTIETSYKQGRITGEAYSAALEALEEWSKLLVEEMERLLVNVSGEDYLIQVLQRRNPRRIDFQDTGRLQILQMSREVEKLGRKLAVRKGRRMKTCSKGHIDLRKSTKRAMAAGGIPFHLMKRDRKPSKPDIWLLCDLSNSVRNFSYFMLLLVYTIQKRYANIRSFIFVDKLLEVTDYLRKQDWNSALDGIGSLKGYNLTGYSHYGNVLYQFSTGYLSQLNKNTTVIILGDAKNNWNKTNGSEVLGDIKACAAALYWLNPMSKDLWNHEDCVMAKYASSCTGAFQCSNIEQLEQVIADIL
jgi:uncharacterized protein with von Willebrand factor type A (vWA) domain